MPSQVHGEEHIRTWRRASDDESYEDVPVALGDAVPQSY